MATTPTYALPYPVGTDRVMDGDNVIQALAERVEALLAQRDAGVVARNVIRNGDCGVAQRGNGPYAVNVCGIDGWLNSWSGGAVTPSRVAAGIGAAMGAGGASWAAQTVVGGQAAAGDYSHVVYRIENVRPLANRQVTLSFLAVAAAGAPKIGVEISQSFGTGGSPSATVLTAISAVTISTVATRYSVTFTVPSIAGKTLGTNGDDYLAVTLWLSAGSTYAARASNIGIQAGTFTLTDVQLEAGPLATAFERLSQQAQLAWCQRYYHRLGPYAAARQHGIIHITQTNGGYVHLLFPVRMRAEPTLGYSVAGDFQTVDHSANGQAVNALALGYAASVDGARFSATGAFAGYTAGQVSELGWANVGNAWLAFSAEL